MNTLDDEWNKFKVEVLDRHNLSDEQRSLTKGIFYAGAICTINRITGGTKIVDLLGEILQEADKHV